MSILCRTCGEPIYNANPRNLFNHENEDIRQNIESLTGIKLVFNSRLPSHICSCCFLDLDHSIEFRSRCLEANQYLLNRKPYDVELKHFDPWEDLLKLKEQQERSATDNIKPRVQIMHCHEPHTNGTKRSRSTLGASTKEPSSKSDYHISMAIVENIKEPRKRRPYMPPLEKKYVCHVCGWTFNDLSNMKDHALRHSGIKKFHCQECSSKFFTRPQLRLHVRVHHKGEMPFVCKYCGIGFRNSPSRCRHELKFHANQLPFVCNLCPKTFVSKISLKKHQLQHETGEVIHRCEPCNKTFKGAVFLRNHFLTGFHRRHVQQAEEKAEESDEIDELDIYSEEDIDYDFADSIIEEVDE